MAKCTGSISSVPDAKSFATGFIKSQYFKKGDGWVQVHGHIDRSKENLSENDGGGQYDIKAPSGSKCAGYSHFVEIIEPDNGRYCIRCCKEKGDCPTGKSTYGCEKVLDIKDWDN